MKTPPAPIGSQTLSQALEDNARLRAASKLSSVEKKKDKRTFSAVLEENRNLRATLTASQSRPAPPASAPAVPSPADANKAEISKLEREICNSLTDPKWDRIYELELEAARLNRFSLPGDRIPIARALVTRLNAERAERNKAHLDNLQAQARAKLGRDQSADRSDPKLEPIYTSKLEAHIAASLKKQGVLK